MVKDRKAWHIVIYEVAKSKTWLNNKKWNQMVNMLFSKVFDENENCVSYLYLKIKGIFLPTQYTT